MTTADIPARRSFAWLLLGAVLIHNLEEGFAYPFTRGGATALLAGLGLGPPPSPAQFWFALAAVTLAAAIALIWSQAGPASSGKLLVLRVVAVVLLANVLIPHAPAALALGGYAPGLASALLINLPLSLIVLSRLGLR